MITLRFIGGPKDGHKEEAKSATETLPMPAEGGVYKLRELKRDKATMVWRVAVNAAQPVQGTAS